MLYALAITIASYYDQCLLDTAWTRIKGNDDMIGCAKVVSVSASCSRCCILALSLCFTTHHSYVL